MELPEDALLAAGNDLYQFQDPDSMVEIPMDDDPVEEVQTSNSSLPLEETNIAEDLDEEELREIGQKVIKDYHDDLESRGEWEEKHARWLEIYYQQDVAKNPPWEGSSEEGIPVLTEAVNQFQSRTYSAFFPNRNFIAAMPVGQSNPEARERAERIGAHMSFQLGVLDRTYKRNKNQMFMAVALHGSDFTKTYFDHLKRRVVIERIRAEDLIIPYHVGPRGIEELERKTHRKFMSVNTTKVLKNLGYFIESGTPYTGDEDISISQDVVDEQQGMEYANKYIEDGRDALILEQHCLLDLDDDGISEPYIIWVDKQSRKVLRIQVRYEVDEFGAPVADKEPIEYFTHYQFLPNSDGFYGFGFGFILSKINLALNKLTRMLIDAGEQSTAGNLTYLISEALGIQGGDFELVMGKGIKIPRSVDDIRKHFMKLDFQGPGPELQVAIEYLQTVGQRLSSSSDILAGQPEKVYQPMALLSMLEQGLQMYSSVQEFLGYSMEEELQKVYRLNAKYLTSEEYFSHGDTQIQVQPEDYKDDFRIVPVFDPKYSTRTQKLAKAQAVYQFALSDPLATQNPKTIWMAGTEYLKALDAENIDELYPEPSTPEIVRMDDQNLENSYYIMPPDKRPLFDVFPDQDHMRHIQTIDGFIANFLDHGEAMEIPLKGEDPESDKPSPVKDQKQQVQGDPGIKRLVMSMSTEQKQELVANLLRHRSQHLAYFYGQINGAMDQQGNPIIGVQNAQGNQPPGQGDTGGMEAPSGNSADLAQIMQLIRS